MCRILTREAMKNPPVWGKVTDARRNATVAEYNVFLNKKQTQIHQQVRDMQIKVIAHPAPLALWFLLLSGAQQLSAPGAISYEQD